MRLVTWNLNSRTNKQDLTEQCDYLRKDDFDIITLQEVLLGSEGFIKDYFAITPYDSTMNTHKRPQQVIFTPYDFR